MVANLDTQRNDVLRAVNTILAIQQPAELRMALQRLIEKIEVEDRQVTICYTFQAANYTFKWRPVRVVGKMYNSLTSTLPLTVFPRKYKETP